MSNQENNMELGINLLPKHGEFFDLDYAAHSEDESTANVFEYISEAEEVIVENSLLKDFFYNEDNEFESEEIEAYERLAEAVREVRGVIQRNSR